MTLTLLSTLQHLRFAYSLILAPIFFASCFVSPSVDIQKAGFLFFILQVFIYPSSHGFNSYYDRDEESIGGIKKPLPVTKELIITSYALESLGLLLSLFLSFEVFLLLTLYGFASKAYSYPPIRIKKYPILGFLFVCFFQGSIISLITQLAVGDGSVNSISFQTLCISFLIVAATYPMTQIYQHKEDAKRGDKTLSRLLGVHGTFLMSSVFFILYFVFQYKELNIPILKNVFTAGFLIWFLLFGLYWNSILKGRLTLKFENVMAFLIGSSVGAFLFYFFCATLVNAAEVRTIKGKIYRQGELAGEPLFLYESKETTDGKKTEISTVFKTAQNETAITEHLVYEAGIPTDYTFEQKQLKQKAHVKMTKEKVFYEFNDELENSSDKDDEDWEEAMVVGPSMLLRLYENWDTLLKGDDVRIRIAVPDMQESFSFKFFIDKEYTENGKTLLKVKLKPTAFFVSLAVKPIIFIFEKNTKKMLRMDGRTLLKLKDGNDWEDLEATSIFE